MTFSGKKKPAQFSPRVKGRGMPGFTQTSEKECTAAMQGKPPQWGKTEADKGPRRDAKKQFGKIPGKAVF